MIKLQLWGIWIILIVVLGSIYQVGLYVTDYDVKMNGSGLILILISGLCMFIGSFKWK